MKSRKGIIIPKKAVKSKTGQKSVKALKQDKDGMIEFNKGKQQLKD